MHLWHRSVAGGACCACVLAHRRVAAPTLSSRLRVEPIVRGVIKLMLKESSLLSLSMDGQARRQAASGLFLRRWPPSAVALGVVAEWGWCRSVEVDAPTTGCH